MKPGIKLMLAVVTGLGCGILAERALSRPVSEEAGQDVAFQSILADRESRSTAKAKGVRTLAALNEWSAWVASATAEDLRKWWLLEAVRRGQSNGIRERLVLQRWVALDRHQAAKTISRHLTDSGWLPFVVELWAQQDFEDAIEFFSQFPKWEHQFVLLIEHVDKEGEERLFLKLQDFSPEKRQYILSVWASHDIRFRMALLDEVPQDDRRRRRFLEDWAEQDLEGLLAWSRLPENAEARDDVKLLRIRYEGSKTLRSLWDSLDDQERDHALQQIKIPPEDYAAMTQWSKRNLTEGELRSIKGQLLQSWAEMPGEPSRLADFYEEWADFGTFPPFGALPSMTQAWAKKDAEGLERWASTLPQHLQIHMVQELFKQWLEDDAAQAVSKLESRFPQILGDVIDKGIIMPGPLTHEPMETFTEAVAALPAEHRARQIEMRLGRYDFDAAEVEALLEMAPAGESKDRAIQLAVAAMANEKPLQAAEWALALEEGIPKDFAMRNVLRAFSNNDPEGSADWVQARLASLNDQHPLALADALERLAVWLPIRALDLATASGQDAAFQAALDKMPLTEQNLQDVVTRTDLSLEQRSQVEESLARQRFLKNALQEID